MKSLNYKLSKLGYIFDYSEKIEKIKYSEYLREFGADETTTPRGIAPRLFVEDKTLFTWGIRGNNRNKLEEFKSEKEPSLTENDFDRYNELGQRSVPSNNLEPLNKKEEKELKGLHKKMIVNENYDKKENIIIL